MSSALEPVEVIALETNSVGRMGLLYVLAPQNEAIIWYVYWGGTRRVNGFSMGNTVPIGKSGMYTGL